VPLVVIPIRTEAAVRGSPLVNYWLVAVNIAAFLVFGKYAPETMQEFAREHLYFRSYPTQFHEFFTYQFLHGDAGHLLGNMLFLWVFGNSVCGKMGGGPYLLFYLSCGVFAAWVNAIFKTEPFFLIGASGAIAGVTTAYLALFPRSYVTVLLWLFFFIQFDFDDLFDTIFAQFNRYAQVNVAQAIFAFEVSANREYPFFYAGYTKITLLLLCKKNILINEKLPDPGLLSDIYVYGTSRTFRTVSASSLTVNGFMI